MLSFVGHEAVIYKSSNSFLAIQRAFIQMEATQ